MSKDIVDVNLPENTIFAKIVAGTIPCKKVMETDRALAFHDISPVAPHHVLVIPKKPLSGVDGTSDEDEALLGHLMVTAKKVARELGFAEDGYRLVVNQGRNGQQSVNWLHIHIIG